MRCIIYINDKKSVLYVHIKIVMYTTDFLVTFLQVGLVVEEVNEMEKILISKVKIIERNIPSTHMIIPFA